MARALRVIGVIAGAVALVATGIGAAAVAASKVALAAAKVAKIASVVSAVATVAGQALTRPPPARGSITRAIIEPNPPTPYVMGEGLVGPIVRHDVAYGPTLKKVPNPYRFMATVFSLGPVHSIEPRIDFQPTGGFYSGFLFTDTQLGATPEPDALQPQWAGAPGWGPNHKLSGLAAIGWSFLFDREGERFANGIDPLAAEGKWVLVYDPRKDSTFPGGSGSHRLGVESTYEWSENPALHAGMYAYGRYQNGKRVFGIGMPADGIDWNVVAAWANVCEANNWTIFGRIFEPGDRWQNLKDICYAGGGEPVPGGVLTFKYAAPKVPLDTITIDDIVTEDENSLVTMPSYRDRLNIVVPQYVSPSNNWEIVDGTPVVNSTFLTEDGEEKRDVWPFNFVKNATQASQLAAYRLFDTREISSIKIVCKPRMRHYRPGECLHIVYPRLGLDNDVIILSRSIDPVTMKVTFELMTETPEKHDFCLGRTDVPPPTPAISQTSEERARLAAARQRPRALEVEFESGETAEDLKPSEAGSNRAAPANANRVPFSLFERADQWPIRDNPSGLAVTGPFVSIVNQRRQLNAVVTFTAPGQVISFGSGRFPVSPGERLSVSSLVEAFGTAEGTWSLTLFLWDSPTTGVAFVVDNGTGAIGFNDGTQAGFIDIPSGYREGELRVYAQSGALGLLNFGVSEPMVVSALPGQTIHPRFTQGRNAFDAADVTNQNTAAFVNGQGALATQNTAGWSQIVSRPFALADDGFNGAGRLLGERLAYVDGATIQSLRPFEVNANVTETRTAAFINGQAPAATDPTIQPGATRTAPGNSNRVRFSQFETAGFWTVRDNTGGVSIVDLAASTVDGRRQFVGSIVYTAAGQLVSFGHGTGFVVVPGERLSVSARLQSVGAAAASWSLAIIFYDANSVGEVTVIVPGSAQRTIATGTLAGFVDVPSNARFAELRVYSQAITTGVLSFGLAEPMVVSAVSGQTLHPPFSPGPNATDGADVTVQQPVVGLLNPATGRANSRRIATQIVAGGVLQTLDVNPISATTSGGVSTIDIAAHTIFDDAGSISFSGGSIGGLAPSTLYYVWEANPNFQGGARTYVATTNRNDLTVFGRRYVGFVNTPASGTTTGGGGWGGGGGGVPGDPNTQQP